MSPSADKEANPMSFLSKARTWIGLVTENPRPDAVFFKNRPKVIQMISPVLEALLGRAARTLSEAAIIEFDLRTERRHV